MKKMKNIEDVKAILELATQVDRALPAVKVQGAKTLWPEIKLTEAEKKYLRLMTREGEPDFYPNGEQKDLWYTVCTEWFKPFSRDEKRRQQWTVLWLKSCGCRVKTIERHVHFGRTKIWYEYKRGMAHLMNYLQISYTNQDLNNLERYKPELIPGYPVGKITGTTKINLLKEWLAELEGQN